VTTNGKVVTFGKVDHGKLGHEKCNLDTKTSQVDFIQFPDHDVKIK